MNEVQVVVIGAGQAGLSSAYHLRRRGVRPGEDFVVLDHAPRPGGAWQSRWPTLTYGRVHGMHALPGMELTGADPARPSADVIGDYFTDYERAFGLRVLRPVHVSAVREAGDGRLRVESTAGEWTTRALINATGTWDRPFWPSVPGQWTFRGRQLHTARYPGPGSFAGERVIVVGGGTSAVQHLLEIAVTAASTAWVTRRPPVFREGSFGEVRGRAAVALVEDRVRRGLPPQSVVSVTGLPMTDAMRRAREAGVLDRLPMFDRVTPEGVRWDDGRFLAADTILWATGFRAAIDHLAPLRLREPGGGIRLEGTRAVRDPRVHLVGYGPSASTIGANRAGRAAVRDILAPSHASPAGEWPSASLPQATPRGSNRRTAPVTDGAPMIDTTVPHSARVWNYWLGGRDNYEVDRVAGDHFRRMYPAVVDLARASRDFLIRTVEYLTREAGIRQFLDIGTGLPAEENIHDRAQRIAPECRVVYVDNDPLVLAHARALLTSGPVGVTDYIGADLREPDAILAAAARTLDLDRPVGLILSGVMGHVPDHGEAMSIVRRLLGALPPGSHLSLNDGTNGGEVARAQQMYNETGAAPYQLRAQEEIARFFDGLVLVEPGLVSCSLWRPAAGEAVPGEAVEAFGGVGRTL